MKDVLVRFLIMIPLIFGACAPQSRHDSANSSPVEVETTYEPPRPTIVKEKGYQIARGATQLKDMKAQFDGETKSMRLTGSIDYLPVKGGNYQKIDVNLVGLLDQDGFIVLKPESSAPSDSLTVAAKATCLSEEGTCTSSFIDIYLYTDGVVYHHQIESREKAPEKKSEEKEKTVPPTENKDQHGEEKREPEEQESETEQEEYEGGADAVEDDGGQYVGTVHDDIETILKVKPAPEPAQDKEERDKRSSEKKQGDEKQETPKKDTPKKDDSKKDDPKKEDPKKEEPKKAEPKREDPKKDEPKNQEPKQDSSKKEDSKEEEPPSKVPTPSTRPEQEEDPVVSKPNIARKSQAIGAVNSGRLENAVNMKEWEDKKRPVGFHIIRPERKTHFTTNEMAYLIDLIGKVTGQMIPGYKLAIGDLSKEKGGRFGKHLSHTNGLDADIAFYFDNKTFQGYFASALSVSKPHPNWMPEEQWKLYKTVVRTQLIDRIFIHQKLKKELCKIAIKNGEITKESKSGPVYETLRRLIADQDHITHFHMRVKCSSAQVRCRQMAEPRHGTGCF